MKAMQRIGTVEILTLRVYPLDLIGYRQGSTEVIVEPGTYPVFSNGLTHYWLMEGFISQNSIRMGDGRMMFTPGRDTPTDIKVSFPSQIYGTEEFQKLLNSPLCQEDHVEQRLRFNLA